MHLLGGGGGSNPLTSFHFSYAASLEILGTPSSLVSFEKTFFLVHSFTVLECVSA